MGNNSRILTLLYGTKNDYLALKIDFLYKNPLSDRTGVRDRLSCQVRFDALFKPGQPVFHLGSGVCQVHAEEPFAAVSVAGTVDQDEAGFLADEFEQRFGVFGDLSAVEPQQIGRLGGHDPDFGDALLDKRPGILLVVVDVLPGFIKPYYLIGHTDCGCLRTPPRWCGRWLHLPQSFQCAREEPSSSLRMCER